MADLGIEPLVATGIDKKFKGSKHAPSAGDDNCNTSAADSDVEHITQLTASTIPHDILSAIFLVAMNQLGGETETYDPSIPTVGYLSGMNPIKLGHVCSHWRTVAASTSELWSTLCIDHPRKSHVNLTNLWLERAGTHPLRITIKTSRYLPIQSSYFVAILQTFVARIDRWHAIDFELPLEVTIPFSHMLEQRKRAARCLKFATIAVQTRTHRLFKIKNHDHQADILTIDSMWNSIHASPALEYVDWKNLYEDRNLPEHAPYSTLTGLEFDYSLETSKILDVLSRSPNMQFFRAHGSPKPFAPKSRMGELYSNPIIHGLQTLSLIASEDMGDFLDRITLPELRKLHITYESPPFDLMDEEQEKSWGQRIKFRQFLLRSGCLLEDIWLKTPPYDDNELQFYLRLPAFETVTRLRLTGTNLVTDSTILFLTLQQKGTDIMPSLNSLWLEIEDTEITDGEVSRMVASRWSPASGGQRISQPSSNLVEVHLKRDFHQAFGPTDISSFSLMGSQGLRVSISPGTLHI